MRYYVRRGSDGIGGRYATGPLTMLETDDVDVAKLYVEKFGGELLDREAQRLWIPTLGWMEYPVGTS